MLMKRVLKNYREIVGITPAQQRISVQPELTKRSSKVLQRAISMCSEHNDVNLFSVLLWPFPLNGFSNCENRLVDRNDRDLSWIQHIYGFSDNIHSMSNHRRLGSFFGEQRQHRCDSSGVR